MATTTLSYHVVVGLQPAHPDMDPSSTTPIAIPRLRPLVSSSCLPLFLSPENPSSPRTAALRLHQRRRTRRRRLVAASLKDSQREVVHHPNRPLELPSNGNGKDRIEDRSEGHRHGSESAEEVVDYLAVKAKEEEGVSLKDEAVVEEEGVSTTVKGTIVATAVLVAFVGAFGGLGFVYKEQINDVLTQFSDFLEGRGGTIPLRLL